MAREYRQVRALQANQGSLSIGGERGKRAQYVFKLFRLVGEYPPVVVTIEEDRSLTTDWGDAEERYANVPVSFPLASKEWQNWIDEEMCNSVRDLVAR